VHFLRRHAARGLDVLAVLVILVAVARFVVLPRLHPAATSAPPVSLATLDGSRFDLQRERGRLVFLDFWASWCEPCQASIPRVQHFKRTHPGVTVESVDVGEDRGLVAPFVRRFRMADVALDPDQTVAHAFGVDGFPTLIAIDPTGRVRARWIGYDPNVEREMGDAVARYAPRVALAGPVR
jgi:thiol-disulfide isomerase/thioredoxin